MIFPSQTSQPSRKTHSKTAWFVEINFESWSVGHEELPLLDQETGSCYDLFGSMRLWKHFNQSTWSITKTWCLRWQFLLAILEPRKANYDFFRIHFAGVNCSKEALNWNVSEVGSTSFQKYVRKNCICIAMMYTVYCILRMQNIYI